MTEKSKLTYIDCYKVQAEIKVLGNFNHVVILLTFELPQRHKSYR